MSADLAPLAEWLGEFQARVRAVDFEGARALCVEEILAFGTVAGMVEGLDGVVERQAGRKGCKRWGPMRPAASHTTWVAAATADPYTRGRPDRLG